jgi:hypothetical protein
MPITAARPARGRLAEPTAVLVAGYVAHVALRLAISVGRDGPTNFADEAGYLVNARVLAGGVAGQMSGTSFYRGGYSLLLLPAQWLGDGPRAEYTLVLATNALLSSLVFPLLYALLTRVFQVETRTALLAAFVAALYPPLVVTTQFAWAESLLPVLVLLAALTLAATVSARRRLVAAGWATGCGLCAGALVTTHGRTTPLALLLVVLLLALAVLRRDLAVAGTAGVVTAAAVTLAGQALNNWLSVRSWGQVPGADLRRVLGNAADPGSIGNVLGLGAGQYWYVLVATFGLVVPGLVALAQHLRGRPRALVAVDSSGAPAVSMFLLGAALGLAVLVGLFLLPPVRPDHLVYGRYVETLVPALLALGLVRLWTVPAGRLARELAAGALLGVVAAVAVARYAGGLVGRSPVNWYSVLALPPLAQSPARISLVGATLAALGGGVVLVVVARRSAPRWSAAGLAVVMVLSAVALRVVLVEARDEAIYGSRPVALSAVAGLDAADEVAYDRAAATPVGFSYQWELDRAHFVLFDSRTDPVPRTHWVIAALDWPQAGAAGARQVWAHPAYDQALWRLP